MADMDATQSHEKYKPKTRPASPPPKPAGKPYKPKSFKDLVRLQDPSKLRNRQASKIPIPLDYFDDYPSTEYNKTPRERSPEEKGEKIYG